MIKTNNFKKSMKLLNAQLYYKTLVIQSFILFPHSLLLTAEQAVAAELAPEPVAEAAERPQQYSCGMK
jgi:hypothetical protein